MGLKAFLAKPFAKFVRYRVQMWSKNPHQTQAKVFEELLRGARDTVFAKDHQLSAVNTYEEFKKAVPIRDYEDHRTYVNRVISGEPNVLWKGTPIYLCKTSGTTSGTKYIPITRESIGNHISAARNALLCYIDETGDTDFVNGKMMFLQGSPELDYSGKIPMGRLSGIVAHHVPNYLLKNRMPSWKTNCLEDWEGKINAIVQETQHENMTLISGIPPWVQGYFEKLISDTGKDNIRAIFPKFSLFVYGGVNFEPYRNKFMSLIGKQIPSIELYPASEGFIAFQDSQQADGMLLILNAGIFYEFIPVNEIGLENPTRISLKDVELDVNYVIILSTNAGLWAYNIGDTIKFVSLNPYRIIVTGRIKHFTSAFGEHVIAEEVEYALKTALKQHKAEVVEFHVAPQVNPKAGELPHHEWFVEFGITPTKMQELSIRIDQALQEKNKYYFDLVEGKTLQRLKITALCKGAFSAYMKSKGKLGGQNKVPRLANDRTIADELSKFALP